MFFDGFSSKTNHLLRANMSYCYEKIITISPKLATLASGQILTHFWWYTDTQTHRRKGYQYTWKISSCHVMISSVARYEHSCLSAYYVVPFASHRPAERVDELVRCLRRPTPYASPGFFSVVTLNNRRPISFAAPPRWPISFAAAAWWWRHRGRWWRVRPVCYDDGRRRRHDDCRSAGSECRSSGRLDRRCSSSSRATYSTGVWRRCEIENGPPLKMDPQSIFTRWKWAPRSIFTRWKWTPRSTFRRWKWTPPSES